MRCGTLGRSWHGMHKCCCRRRAGASLRVQGAGRAPAPAPTSSAFRSMLLQRFMTSSSRPGVPINTCPPASLNALTSCSGSLQARPASCDYRWHVQGACRRVVRTGGATGGVLGCAELARWPARVAAGSCACSAGTQARQGGGGGHHDLRAAYQQHAAESGHAVYEGLGHGVDLLGQLARGRHHHRRDLRGGGSSSMQGHASAAAMAPWTSVHCGMAGIMVLPALVAPAVQAARWCTVSTAPGAA